MIHQLRRAGERAAMRNGTVMRNGVYEKHRGKASGAGEGSASGKRRGSVITLRPITVMGPGAADGRDQNALDPEQLKLSREIDVDGHQVVSMAGELDIATAQQAYAYISDVIDNGKAPVSVDLAGVTFCDASGLGVLARAAKHARRTGGELMLTSARPSVLKIMRITGLDTAFPELSPRPLAHRLS